MGLMARLIEAKNSQIETKGNAPGESVVIQGELGEEGAITPELYQQPGLMSRPPDGARGVYVPLRNGRGYGVVVATHNYRLVISPEPEKGETVLYSTNADGDTVHAKIKLDASGNISLNGNDKRLVTYEELNSALQSMVSAINTGFAAKLDGGGSPGTVTLNISAAETTTVRTGG
ncbi:MAG: hypothetical protein ACOC2N_00090 [Spirochaetota bacterium]